MSSPKGHSRSYTQIYRDRYWKIEHFNAINKMGDLLKEHHPDENISMAEAAYRWVSLDDQSDRSILVRANFWAKFRAIRSGKFLGLER